jgi:hypothetical protein
VISSGGSAGARRPGDGLLHDPESQLARHRDPHGSDHDGCPDLPGPAGPHWFRTALSGTSVATIQAVANADVDAVVGEIARDLHYRVHPGELPRTTGSPSRPPVADQGEQRSGWTMPVPPAVAPPMTSRSCINVRTATRQPPSTLPRRQVSGMRTPARKTSLISAAPVFDFAGHRSCEFGHVSYPAYRSAHHHTCDLLVLAFWPRIRPGTCVDDSRGSSAVPQGDHTSFRRIPASAENRLPSPRCPENSCHGVVRLAACASESPG